MLPNTPLDQECQTQKCRDHRYALQQREHVETQAFAVNALRQAISVLEEAARKLSQYGEAPFDDLERGQ